jgi:hypothetical protein
MSSSMSGPTFVEISWVEVTDEDIAKVSERSGLTPERIHRYLDSDEQDNNILRHFAFFRVYPIGKLFKSYTSVSG